MRYFAFSFIGLAAVALLAWQGGRRGGGQQQGGPPAVFYTDVPASPLNVIAGAPTDSSIRLSILSTSKQSLRLRYRMSGTRADASRVSVRIDVTPDQPKVVDLSGLKPGARYEYTLSNPAADSNTSPLQGSFTTAKKPGASFVFDIQADSHLDGNTDPKVYANTLRNITADKPDFLVDLGDTFMVDKYQNFLDSLKQYKAQRYWFSIPGSEMSVFLCLGNHDGEYGWRTRGSDSVSDWSRAQRQFFFPSVQANAFYTGAPAKGLYYSWTWGDALFVVLDPFVATTLKPRSAEEGWNWTLGETQLKWLETTLWASKAKYKFLFIHHLVGGFGKEARGGVEASTKFEWGDEEEFPTKRTGWAEPIHALMVKYKVSALFHGHDHLYVRQSRDGITYLEVPQPSQTRGDNTRSAEEYGYKSGKLLGSSGHIRVTVGPEITKFEYVKCRLEGTNREVVDSGTISPEK